MSMPNERSGLSRRGVLGLGAGAATVAAGASLLRATPASAVPTHQTPLTEPGPWAVAGDAPESVTLEPAPLGTRSITHDWTSFIPTGVGVDRQAGTTVGTYIGATLVGGTTAAVALRVPTGASVVRVDLVGFTTALATYSANLVLSRLAPDDYVAVNSLVAAGTGSLAASYTFPTPRKLEPGETLWLDCGGVTTQKYFVAATVHYLPVGEFIPVTPSRIYDSRLEAGALAKGATRTLSVANQIASAGGAANVVPAGARAVACNITVTSTVGPFGYLTVVPGGGSVAGPSTINWDREGATIANGFQVGLDANRQITVGCDGVAGVSTQFIIDVTGYYS
jgi:hypothetical protein